MSSFEVVYSLEDREARKAAQAENGARLASEVITHRTKDVGQILVAEPIKFTNVFIEPPAILTGMVLVKTPGDGWRYPMVTAGVHKWLLTTKGLYVGAYVYFHVDVQPDDGVIFITDPIRTGRDENLRYALPYTPPPALVLAEEAVLGEEGAQNSIGRFEMEQIARRAEYVTISRDPAAGELQKASAKHAYVRAMAELAAVKKAFKRRPPKPVIDHHLMFQGTAMKSMTDDVTQQLLGLFE